MANERPLLAIGTRGSPLALAQARMTAAALAAASGVATDDIAIEVISTTGDRTQDRPLSEIGGKGLFTKEIDNAQLEGRVDVAVHSSKDLPTVLPDGLVIAGFLPREDVRDALIAPRHKTLDNLPAGGRVGTVSLRRQALVRQLRPDLHVEALRGNVETRLNRARTGDFDAVILAMAGLKRLGLDGEVTEALDETRFIPAVGQGAIALVTRADDTKTRELIARFAHHATAVELAAERAFLAVLDGSCRTPIGGNARYAAGRIAVRGIVLKPDGSAAHTVEAEAPEADAEALGIALGQQLRERMGPGFLDLKPGG
ncbi:MAG TPA: hydroxymethylbilane synthase [Rhabdaerophilum sp.]|nr:hydroxymethylbilane synthase [Rhabdaerophilum sp.]